jgi:hypothetical protein
MRIEHILEDERTRCEIWSRVMGYFRPVASWNTGKRSEYKDRKFFTTEKSEAINHDV